MEKGKLFTPPGFELPTLGRPACSQSLYRLNYSDSLRLLLILLLLLLCAMSSNSMPITFPLMLQGNLARRASLMHSVLMEQLLLATLETSLCTSLPRVKACASGADVVARDIGVAALRCASGADVVARDIGVAAPICASSADAVARDIGVAALRYASGADVVARDIGMAALRCASGADVVAKRHWRGHSEMCLRC
jgi:hypothetical protein